MAAVVCLAWGAADGMTVYADDVTACDEHVYDYDCDTTCNICGAKRVASHTYDDFGRSYHFHWKVCDCGARLDSEPHVYDSMTDLTCSECGYVRHLEHNYNIPGADSTYHWMECECGEKQNVEKHTLVPKYDDIHHWQECICGTKVDAAVHVWGEGRVEGDVTYYTCTICGAEKSTSSQGGDIGGGDTPGTDATPTPTIVPGGNTGDDTPGGDDNPSGGENTPGGEGSEGGNGEGDDGSGKQSKVDGRLLAIATGSGLTIWGGIIGGYFLYKKKKGLLGAVKEKVTDTL